MNIIIIIIISWKILQSEREKRASLALHCIGILLRVLPALAAAAFPVPAPRAWPRQPLSHSESPLPPPLPSRRRRRGALWDTNKVPG